eukprot:jgi/Undpi1/12450/HiC_scaffold_5.g02121.m1
MFTVEAALLHRLSSAGCPLRLDLRPEILLRDLDDCEQCMLETVAADPAASATFFRESLQAVFDCLSRVGVADGDGDALGEMQAHIGMTQEKFRLTSLAHLLVWVCGYNSGEQLREDTYPGMQEITSSGRVAVGCMMCGAPAIVSLLPTFGYVSDDRPLPRHARAVRAEDGAGDEDDDGPLGTWHMFARLQSVRGGSAVMLALQDVARLACPAFSPHRGRGGLGSTIQGPGVLVVVAHRRFAFWNPLFSFEMNWSVI